MIGFNLGDSVSCAGHLFQVEAICREPEPELLGQVYLRPWHRHPTAKWFKAAHCALIRSATQAAKLTPWSEL